MQCRSPSLWRGTLTDRWSETGRRDLSGAKEPSLTEQLRGGIHGLRFDGELESAYRRDQFYDRLRYLRINLAAPRRHQP